MTNLSESVLKNHMIRKKYNQKTAFINELCNGLKANGFDPVIQHEKTGFKSRNIIIGNPYSAKFVISAHYDTPATLGFFPNLATPLNLFFFLLYQLILALGILLIPAILGLLVLLIPMEIPGLEYSIALMVFGISSAISCLLIMVGFANKNNYNDNTSGVITLIETLLSLNAEEKDKICVVFFDHEELGLLGSRAFLKRYKDVFKRKMLFNFDCVADGETFVFVYNKYTKQEISYIEKAFSVNNRKVILRSKSRALYPSDQVGFIKGMGICSCHRNFLVGYYFARIHTNFDTKFDINNIIDLKDGIINYLKRSVENERVFS